MSFEGEVKSFNSAKGYGFIESAGAHQVYNKDIFVLKAAMPDSTANRGDKVSFTVVIEGNGPVAHNVQMISRAPASSSSVAAGAGAIGGSFTGTVKSFHADRGWGLITCQATEQMYGKDIFFGKAVIPNSSVNVGEQVQFTLKMEEKGPAAATLEPLGQASACYAGGGGCCGQAQWGMPQQWAAMQQQCYGMPQQQYYGMPQQQFAGMAQYGGMPQQQQYGGMPQQQQYCGSMPQQQMQPQMQPHMSPHMSPQMSPHMQPQMQPQLQALPQAQPQAQMQGQAQPQLGGLPLPPPPPPLYGQQTQQMPQMQSQQMQQQFGGAPQQFYGGGPPPQQWGGPEQQRCGPQFGNPQQWGGDQWGGQQQWGPPGPWMAGGKGQGKGRQPDPNSTFFGVLKTFHKDKGWGHIGCEATYRLFGKDVFLLQGTLQGQNIEVGMLLSFKVGCSQKGPQASNASVLPPGSFSIDGKEGSTFTGTIKTYTMEKAWGFVGDDELSHIFGKDVFFHKKDLPASYEPKLDDKLQFHVELNEQGQPVVRKGAPVGEYGAINSPGLQPGGLAERPGPY